MTLENFIAGVNDNLDDLMLEYQKSKKDTTDKITLACIQFTKRYLNDMYKKIAEDA